jgi:hypothetical protein
MKGSAQMGTSSHQVDSTSAGAGVEGNARLTAMNAMVLIALLAVEGLTIISVRRFITLHIFLGILVIGPVMLKTGSTMYRFARYYTGAPSYLAKGPPHPVLRVLGPLVIVSSLTLLGTGLALLTAKPGSAGLLLTAHQASFIVWVASMTIHVLGHLKDAFLTSWRDLREGANSPAGPKRTLRLTLIALALIFGVATATALMPAAASWTNGTADRHDR